MAKLQSPILDTFKAILAPLFGRPKAACTGLEARFRLKYVHFNELLESNAEVLKIIARIEEKLSGRQVFGMSLLHSAASQAVFHCLRMVRGYENMSGQPMPVLRARIESIREDFKAILAAPEGRSDIPFVLPFSQVTRHMVDQVGGKSANLGEVSGKLGLPVPDGFAITTAAFGALLRESDLAEEIAKRIMELDPDDPASIQQASEDIQHRLLLAPLPGGLEQTLLEAHARLAERLGEDPETCKVAMRSSAVGEDGEFSFAGQYLSVLGVRRAKLVESYRYVLASLYTPRAIAYRLLKGVPDESTAMGVACLAMVRSSASGVMYTRHPFDSSDENILINAVWGLGPYAVDGIVTPDTYVVDKASLALLRSDIAEQTVRLECSGEAGVTETRVEAAQAGKPCLSPGHIAQLAEWGRMLEDHYGQPQDVEWAVDQRDRLVVLQARPLAAPPGAAFRGGRSAPPAAGAVVLLEQGATACPGVASGPAVLVRSEDDLAGFPPGGVLVASHSSPTFMVVMPKAAAILADHGSVTGHMASLSREFNVPTILDLRQATTALSPGQTLTVDATNGRVYQGRVEALLAGWVEPPAPMRGTPVYALLQALAEGIVPLNLVDPKSPQFTPEHCRTLHDIIRYLHECSYEAMFQLGDMAAGQGGMAVKLAAAVGLDLYVIDLGGGLNREALGKVKVKPEMVTSRPFKALLAGLADPAYVACGPRPLQLRGFLSVMGKQMVDGGNAGGERFGEKSYAIISDKYLNFSSRVGYHYGVLDSYCGQTVNKNYIIFKFKGGAAGEERRERRARAIALIMEALGFTVTVTADSVEGRFQKYPPEVIEGLLTRLGHLLQFTRQTDMLMVGEHSVQAMAGSFLRGDCVFEDAGG